jgi:histo-blood group ABO system transferase
MKVLVAIKACHRYVPMTGKGWDWTNQEKHRSNNVDEQIKACRDTWVKDFTAYLNTDVRFFYGQGANRALLSDEVVLDCCDDYKSLPYKTKAICAWAVKQGYDHIFMTDDDTYIWVDRLMGSGFEAHDYIGAISYLGKYPYATGLGYWVSRRSADLIANGRITNTLEDHWVGEVLHKSGIAHKYDDRYRSIGAKFLKIGDLFKPGIQTSNIAIHPCTSEMMHACYDTVPDTKKQTALIIIATGETYRRNARQLIDSAKQFFVPHDVIIFTDDPTGFTDCIVVEHVHLGFPRATLMRYHAIWGAREILSKYDQLFYSDADMLFVAPVTADEIFSGGITATEHPGYVGVPGTPETNPRSTACCPTGETYFCGGFNGGASSAFLQMAETIKEAVNTDDANGILAIWHDESHLQRYLYDHPPAKILDPSFCYPQSEYQTAGRYAEKWKRAGRVSIVPKLLALDKESR